MKALRIALAQLRPALADKAANVATAARIVGEAAARQADIVLFPELFLAGYFTRDRTREFAEPVDGPLLRILAGHARSHQIAIVMGFPELDRARDAVYDSVCLISAAGEFVDCYRKTHLYGEEHQYFSPGSGYVVADVAGCPVGPMICFDVEFPEMARLLALAGARILLVSSANMVPFEVYQDTYLKARALENHAFVALTNRVGTEERTEFFGGSGACDPLGRVLCRAGAEETLLFADLDLALIEQAQTPLAYFANRRPDLYGPLAKAGPDGAASHRAPARGQRPA